MNTNDLSQMQQEIDRLNKIITVLLEQIDLLKINYWYLQQQILSNQAHDRQVLQPMGINKENDSHVQQEMGMNKMHPSHMQQDTGINKMHHSHVQQTMPVKQVNDSHVLQGMPVNEVQHSHLLQTMPIKQVNDSRELQGMPINEVQSSHLLEALPIKQIIYPEVQQAMRVKQPDLNEQEKGMTTNQLAYTLPPTLSSINSNNVMLGAKLGEVILKRSRNSARNGAAKLLIHFYNKGTGKYDELQKIIGYSTSGLAKLMIMMRKKGLIHRKSFQRFAPSEKALQLMQEAKLK